MQCPVDGTVLAMADRQGIEIDYCPQCRGVWLDRGELDKLIDRAAGAADPVVASRERPRYRDDDDDDDDDRRFGPLGGLGGHGGQGGQKRKKKSFLSEMFEFGD